VADVQLEPGLTALAFRAFQPLNLKHDEPLSDVAFNFNVQPYYPYAKAHAEKQAAVAAAAAAQHLAGRCRLTLGTLG